MNVFLDNIGVFRDGVLVTLALAAASTAVALPLGVLLAVMRVSPVEGFRMVGTVYVGIVRNIPLTVVFFFSAFVLPQLGVRFSYFGFAVIALVAYYASFFCEAVRSGINAVPVGQAEAARSIGLPFHECLRFVILPQALRSSIPPMVNVMIALVKNTAVASAFGVTESLGTMELLANRESTAVLSVLIATGLVYLAITIPLGLLTTHIERKVAFSR
ncbi:amino acid ABC transporter permease [Ancylobacter mangrovi]|uniref:amino acid ABC transporter permease n=1 Tax=Ancylobacter mangrovi TaxID=2972472 RepID=UPI002161AC89|nr:amino acid ABC transporter permease [Ancylobacter mangrovi]MCS0502056.1 amino acid ABC transporter permease [Ancylobacter mangrovi]